MRWWKGERGSALEQPLKIYGRTMGERVAEKLRKEHGGCWLWTGAVDSEGYARLVVGDGARDKVIVVRLHRWAYEQANGPVPEGLVVDHICCVRCCLNPDHLQAVTAEINTSLGADRRSTCRRGHPYAVHGRVYSDGFRHCTECRRLANGKAA